MATKSDLIEAQNFSRRRLLTAFVSGAPGGKELEPSAPLRPVIAAIALAVIVVLVGVFYGFIRPGLPQGWENGKLLLVSDTGARFATVDGVLHPVINTASARLLLPSSDFSVISTSEQNISGTQVGETLGIVGAPDELPPSGHLDNVGWSACVTNDAAIDVQIGSDVSPRIAEGRAAVVESDGILYVVTDERSYPIAANDTDAVLRAAGITTLAPVRVPSDWINLFTPGTALTPLIVQGTGESVAGTTLKVGDVVHVAGRPEGDRLLVQRGGLLAALTPLAWQLYQLGTGSALGNRVTEVSASDVAGLATAARPAGGVDWPEEGFSAVGKDELPCASLVGDNGQSRTALSVRSADVDVSAGVHVQPGHGALVRAGGRGEQSTGIVTLVDATGTAYPLPGATEETILRLGYGAEEVGNVSDDWTALLSTGPSLTEEAAGRSPSGTDSASR